MMSYLVIVSIILAICLIFYRLLIQKETFYSLNRVMLIACIALSFSLPIVPAPAALSFREPDIIESLDPLSSLISINENNPVAPLNDSIWPKALNAQEEKNIISFTKYTIIDWVELIYWTGVAIFGINLLIQIIILIYRAYTLPAMKDGSFHIVEIKGDKAPCSFGNSIFINPAKYDWETYNQILLHEKVHVRQRHTFDILIAELALVFLWFNPFAWFYRRDVENNLEYLTDATLIQTQAVEVKSYQMSLIKVSVPNYPLSVTTNYNQCLLKKRIAKMNAKRSNLNTAWKYMFLAPIMFVSVCLLNEPSAKAAENNNSVLYDNTADLHNEGYWFAELINDSLHVQFKKDRNDKAMNGTIFPMSEIKGLRSASDSFSLAREAGTMAFMGKIENNQGMGRYKFTSDETFRKYLGSENILVNEGDDMLTYFMVDLTRPFISMLKKQGYVLLAKKDLVPLAALKVDADFINMFRGKGYTNIRLSELIALKGVGVTSAYVDEIRNAGYPNITPGQLISLKAQHIDTKYINAMRSASGISLPLSISASNNVPQPQPGNINNESTANVLSENTIVAMKSLNINNNYKNLFSALGYTNITNENLVAMKSLSISPSYIKSFYDYGYGMVPIKDIISLRGVNATTMDIEYFRLAGYPHIDLKDLVAAKSLKINNAYIELFVNEGYGLVPIKTLISLKSLAITPDLVDHYKRSGFPDITLNQVITLRSLKVTSSLIEKYRQLGFSDLSINDITTAKATGTSPEYIAAMRQKGYDFKKIDNYISSRTEIR